jgi:Myosin N-terminal SH3-like domain
MPKVVKDLSDDPDPSEWLFISLESKRIDQSKPYDGKTACWVPDENLGYILGAIKGTKGEMVTVETVAGEVISKTRNQKRVTISISIDASISSSVRVKCRLKIIFLLTLATLVRA